MSISAIGGNGAVLGSTSSNAASQSDAIDQSFLDYMKESPMQRRIDAWLKAHNLTEQSLEALPPEKRDAIIKEMANDIKNETKRDAESKAQNVTSLAS